MRLVAWNCNMALDRKFAALRSLRPDVAVISECASPERLRPKLDLARRGVDLLWVGRNPHKGLAVLGFKGNRVRLLPGHDPGLEFIAPVRVDGPVPFNLLAVWAQNASGGNTRKDQPGPLNRALARYRAFLTTGPAAVAGDFNNNVFWDKPGWAMNHAGTVTVLESYGLVSAYHAARGEAQGSERTPTHYWRDRKKDGPTYHIDYIFVPRDWTAGLRELRVGRFAKWCGSGLSDHVPLVVDVAL
jgi:exodeoxyribonuclease-3